MNLRVARKILRNYYQADYRRTTIDRAYKRVAVAESLAVYYFYNPEQGRPRFPYVRGH